MNWTQMNAEREKKIEDLREQALNLELEGVFEELNIQKV